VITALLSGKLGHHITLANNGREAIELHTRERFDVILMDIHMPEMDGLDAVRLIRVAAWQTPDFTDVFKAEVKQLEPRSAAVAARPGALEQRQWREPRGHGAESG
jgi:CheY-like chemotaxis protein